MSELAKDEVLQINTVRASNPIGAIVDARLKSSDAVANYPKFFNKAHLEKVSQVYDIVNGFIRVKKGIYINHRENRGKPFSVIKVDGCEFPHVKPSVKAAAYTNPLTELGVEIVFSPSTNSYLYRIR
jgi:hypothetical protein